jgi:hypothetical protein
VEDGTILPYVVPLEGNKSSEFQRTGMDDGGIIGFFLQNFLPLDNCLCLKYFLLSCFS